MARLGKPVTEFASDYSVPYNREVEDAKWDAFRKFTETHKVIRFQIADGYATYLVESEKPLVLRHIEGGDNYRVQDALIRGLRLADVSDMLRREASMRKLFGGK